MGDANHMMQEAIAHETKGITSRICYSHNATVLKSTNLEDCITGTKRGYKSQTQESDWLDMIWMPKNFKCLREAKLQSSQKYEDVYDDKIFHKMGVRSWVLRHEGKP